jgi:hypothetical protein
MQFLWFVLNSIFLAVFNAAFFVVGGAYHNAAVWLSYGFIHFAYLMLLLAPKMIAEGKSAAVFGFSLYSTSSCYFLAELIVGLAFILAAPEDYRMAFLVQLCLAGLHGALLVAHVIANEHTAMAEEARQYDVSYIKDASAKLKGMLDKVKGRDARRKMESAYDALYSSPTKSYAETEQAEDRILSYIGRLGNAVAAGDEGAAASLSDSLLDAINERNSQVRALH